MSIAEFIQSQIFSPHLKQKGCLVVYDPARRYRNLCLVMASDATTVVDASDSSLESRETALKVLRELASSHQDQKGLLVYVPVAVPVTDEERQRDPFAVYGACGKIFPDGAGDDYEQICLRAKPDHSTEIRRIFTENPNPSFAVIDAIGGGMNWPNLRALLKVESAGDILLGLLAPNKPQEKVLKETATWVQEARDFLHAALRLNLLTRATAWSAISDEIWRYLLFSEFSFDLPGNLPTSLDAVPRAPNEARPLVEATCDRLRSDLRTQSLYIKKAEDIERVLNLANACAGINDFGLRDTFPFEERSFLKQAIRALRADDIDLVREIMRRRKTSIWLTLGESQVQWNLIEAAQSLMEVCSDYERQLADYSRSQVVLLDFYANSLRDADRRQREFEQSVNDYLDTDELMTGVIDQARSCYRRLSEKVQIVFTRHLEGSGWPPTGRLANTGVFERFVEPHLRERGRKIAYILVDALRYELGVELENLLSEDGPVELYAAYAHLPTITLVGMASLLPGAATDLYLANEAGSLVPRIEGEVVGNVAQRMNRFRNKLGDRFKEMVLGDFIRATSIQPPTVDLLVIRSYEIDSQLESSPEDTLKQVPQTLKRIRVALHKLRRLGFKEAVIATDHGFFLNTQAEAGDVCTRPQGNWPVINQRSMLGQGHGDSHSLVVSAEKVGIRGDFANFATPWSMAPYRNGLLYFHGGASLAEAVVPVLVAKLESKAKVEDRQFKVELTYKAGAKRITTLLPVIEVVLVSQSLLSLGTDFEILLEAQDATGNVVGEAQPGGLVNPATRTVTLSPNKREKIAILMQKEFEGTFSIKALNPTTLETFCSLPLETDYMV